MSIIKYSVRNPIIVNMLMIAILILGTVSLLELPRELNPKVAFNYVFIIVPYPGVGAEEVEKMIVVPLENAVDDIEDLKMMSSESNEGSGFVWLQFEDLSEVHFRERLNEVETAVNRVELPEGAQDPIVEDFDSGDYIPVISLSIVGDMPERRLHDLAEEVRDELLDIDGVAKVALTGTRDREIWIEIEPERLRQHRISLSRVVASLGNRNLNLPAGDLLIGRESYLVRTIGEVKTPEGFRSLVVRWDPSGNHLHLGDIATVEDRWEKERTRSRMDGAPAVTLSVSKKTRANSLDVVRAVKAVGEKYRDRLPFGAKIVFTNDTSIYIKDILFKLQTNAILGFMLVILMLYIFMGLRNALVAAVGIPIAFMATFIFMNQTGQTFNSNSLFGLMLILGVVVDDAIIVVENCFRHRQRGLSRVEAAVTGTTEVFWPVVSATTTTIAAFLPLILMTGIMGKFMRIIPIVVSLTLLASLVEVFLIAPSHFAEWGGTGHPRRSRWFTGLRRLYVRILVKLIRRRYWVGPMVLFLALLLSGVIPLVGVDLFRGHEFSQFMVWVTMPVGSTLDETDRVIKRIESAARSLPKEEVHTVISSTGILQMETDWIYAEHVGQVAVDLVESELRRRSVDEIMNDLRGRIAGIAGPVDLRLSKISGGPPVGKAVEVKVKGKYFDELSDIADELKAVLDSIPGVYDVGDDWYPGKDEVRVVVDEEQASLFGLSVAAIAAEVRAAVDGIEATVFRDADEEIDVRVKLAGIGHGGLDELMKLPLVTPSGESIRLDRVCRFETGPTVFRIRRFEQERAITVSADVDKRVTTAVEVNREIARRFADLPLRHPGCQLDFRGEMKEFQESIGQLGRLFLFGVILIFTILGAQFKSVRQAFIILLTIPFGFIGAMIGLFVIGSPLSIVTMYAIVALAGIAVNDAIVMVSFINNSRAAGVGKLRSVIESGRIRLRPIILTSLTTILGLLPMAVGMGGKSEMWGPFANTIVFGLAAATILTLLVIPTVYIIIVDEWFGLKPLGWKSKRT